MDWLKEILPNWKTLLVVIGLGALLAYFLTMGVKKLGTDYYAAHNKAKPWWWASFLRTTASLIGLGVGAGIDGTLIGCIVGLLAGGFSALIVAVMKKRLVKHVPEVAHVTGTWSTSLSINKQEILNRLYDEHPDLKPTTSKPSPEQCPKPPDIGESGIDERFAGLEINTIPVNDLGDGFSKRVAEALKKARSDDE